MTILLFIDLIFVSTTKGNIMTTEKLLELLKIEIQLNGHYTERRKAIEEMLRMKGVKF